MSGPRRFPGSPLSRRWGLALAAAGLCLMGYGIFRGEMDTVFDKAVRICMECIGIG